MPQVANIWDNNMFSSYQNVWFCGLAASGKTTTLKLIHQKLPKIEFLNDSLEMVQFIRADQDQKHHSKPTPDSFILKDSEPVYYSVKKLFEKTSQNSNNKIIELSRGTDKLGQVDFSYQYLFSNLPEKLRQNSLFIYIDAPYEDRKARNQARPSLGKRVTTFESFFCPVEAFDRFFTVDDFWTAVQKYPVNFLYIPNLYSLDLLKTKIENLF